MKIAIDARGATWYHGTGIGTYTENILTNLLNIDESNEYLLYWSGENYLKYKKENCKVVMTSRKHQRFFQHHYFPRNLKHEKVDLYHIPQNGIGMIPEIECSKIVTIHDLIPYIMPETVGRGYLTKFLREMPQIIENSNGILTVSEYSKKDILKFFPIDPDKIFVTPLAANHKFKPLDKNMCSTILKDKYNISGDFFLYMGGFSDRKNVHSLIEAFSKLYKNTDKDISLIILGSYRDSSQKLVKLVEANNMSERIKFAGFIPEDDVPLFFNCCYAFVYPSLYEGFGLPPLEAMHCGAPVIVSNTTSIPEVVDDAGLTINPYDTEDLVEAMGTLLTNNSLRESLCLKSLERVKDFSWKITAEKTLKAYNEIYDRLYSL